MTDVMILRNMLSMNYFPRPIKAYYIGNPVEYAWSYKDNTLYYSNPEKKSLFAKSFDIHGASIATAAVGRREDRNVFDMNEIRM